MGLITKFFLLFAVLKVRAENLKKEKDILKMSDVRLTQQRESLLVEQRGQNLLLTNLRTIQVCGVILRSEFDLSFRVFNNYPLKWNKTVMELGLKVDYFFLLQIDSECKILKQLVLSKFVLPVVNYNTLLFTWESPEKFELIRRVFAMKLATKLMKQSKRKKSVC